MDGGRRNAPHAPGLGPGRVLVQAKGRRTDGDEGIILCLILTYEHL